ncbi:MAG: nitroreductase [Kiritimatiellia bacterium]|jgi:nitroreductase
MNEPENAFDVPMVHRLIRGRRTVKPPQYSDRLIDRSIIEAILENANWAPTHGLTQPWRFTVFTGDGLKRLSCSLPALYDAVIPAAEQKPGKLEKLAAQSLQASHAILLGVQTGLSPKIPALEDVEALACAVQNMQLTARAYGIGAFWSTGIQCYDSQANAVLDLEEGITFLGVLYLGYPKHFFPPGAREPVTDRVQWIETDA